MAYGIPLEVYQIISEDLKKELAAKYDVELLRQEMKTMEIKLKKEVDIVRKEIDIVRKEIEITRVEFKKDLRNAVIILIAILVILNQNSLEFLAKLIGIVK